MERKRKIKRASILAVFIYVMINGFVWGFMKAYLNSYNIISKDQLVMAEVNNNNSKTEIKILNKKFYFDKNKSLCSANTLIFHKIHRIIFFTYMKFI